MMWRLGLVSVFGLVLTVGCGSDLGKVSGTILLDDGSPLESGTVIMENVAKPEIRLVGKINAGGQFSVGVKTDGDSVPLGRYKVYLANTDSIEVTSSTDTSGGREVRSEDRKMTKRVASEYMTPSRTPIEFEVKHGRNTCEFSVKRP
ncbi:MAG: hypothetical protein ACRC46_13050 [Thermoguttaceae bacterium]